MDKLNVSIYSGHNDGAIMKWDIVSGNIEMSMKVK